jgi:hypothetical protein
MPEAENKRAEEGPVPAPQADAARLAPEPVLVEEIVHPTPVTVRTEYRTLQGPARPVLAALTAHALWLQDTWQLRQIPLRTVAGVEAPGNAGELVLTLGPDDSAERLRLMLVSARERRHWVKDLEDSREQLSTDTPAEERPVPEGVALVRRAPDVAHVDLGWVTFTGRGRWATDRGLQLRAGMRGADAVIRVQRRRCPESGWGVRQAGGVAIRVTDAAAGQRLRHCWHAEEVSALLKRMLLVLTIQALVLFLVSLFCTSALSINRAIGKSPQNALLRVGTGLALLYAWPLVVMALARVLRWPSLLRTAGLGFLAVTTGRGLAVALAHVLAVRAAAAPLASSYLWLLADPVDWAITIAGVVLCVRAWRLAGETRRMLPTEEAVPPARTAWARALVGLTAAYALGLPLFAGYFRYQMSATLLQPKVGSREEEEAVLEFNQGVARLQEGNLADAEPCFRTSLDIWQKLGAEGDLASAYDRANLTRTLYNLGWLCHKQGHLDEAEGYYARAAAVGERAAFQLPDDSELRRCLSDTREVLAEVRRARLARLLDQKDQDALRKYEEGQVQGAKGAAGAEGLYREAIVLWEEILPQATDPDPRRVVLTRLEAAYLVLAEHLQQHGKPADEEAALLKGIDYGEQAVTLAPDRPLARHNLDVARQMLERRREQAHLDEINKLWAAERYADAFDLCARGVADQEERVRTDRDREAAVRRLAYRLDRFAWLLAHCPDGRVRDPKAAVKYARRATELQGAVGDYWYTLALVQYRNRDWGDSLRSLEQLKTREGAYEANGLLLLAMNRHQLNQPAEARAALRQAVTLIEDQKRKAEGDALLRFQWEMARPGIEALRREAEALIEGKDPAAVGVG